MTDAYFGLTADQQKITEHTLTIYSAVISGLGCHRRSLSSAVSLDLFDLSAPCRSFHRVRHKAICPHSVTLHPLIPESTQRIFLRSVYSSTTTCLAFLLFQPPPYHYYAEIPFLECLLPCCLPLPACELPNHPYTHCK